MYVSLLFVQITFLTVAYFYKGKEMRDKKKIKAFFEITKVCVQHKGEI
ncbi:cell division protein FtsK, partial [Bacillus cereus]|nr:cell division protein FtsK [Bacillus cereus]